MCRNGCGDRNRISRGIVNEFATVPGGFDCWITVADQSESIRSQITDASQLRAAGFKAIPN